MTKYFYQFLEPIYPEVANILQELEGIIYNSPRSMLTHSRTLMEAILEKVMVHEGLPNEPYLTIRERIEILESEDLISKQVKKALHDVRKYGNIAAHDVRQFRYSESLITWENIYIIIKWFVEVYGDYKIEVPEYVDPKLTTQSSYNLEEINIRFQRIEELLKQSIAQEQPKNTQYELQANAEVASTIIEEEIEHNSVTLELEQEPGYTPVRTISFKDQTVEIPYFLRDAFLLPQKFPNSERYLLRLNEEQQARIMSELPASLDYLHTKISRFNEEHTERFFNELKLFIEEEKRRKKLIQDRPGELFLFYNGDEIVVTEEFGKIEINKENFTGFPGLIDQLNEDGITQVSDLPKEFVIIGKYNRVGPETVNNFFQQLKQLQQRKISESMKDD